MKKKNLENKEEKGGEEMNEQITIDDFGKMDMRIGEILEAEKK